MLQAAIQKRTVSGRHMVPQQLRMGSALQQLRAYSRTWWRGDCSTQYEWLQWNPQHGWRETLWVGAVDQPTWASPRPAPISLVLAQWADRPGTTIGPVRETAEPVLKAATTCEIQKMEHLSNLSEDLKDWKDWKGERIFNDGVLTKRKRERLSSLILGNLLVSRTSHL